MSGHGLPPFGRLYGGESGRFWAEGHVLMTHCRWCAGTVWRQFTLEPDDVPMVWMSTGFEVCPYCDVGDERLDGFETEILE